MKQDGKAHLLSKRPGAAARHHAVTVRIVTISHKCAVGGVFPFNSAFLCIRGWLQHMQHGNQTNLVQIRAREALYRHRQGPIDSGRRSGYRIGAPPEHGTSTPRRNSNLSAGVLSARVCESLSLASNHHHLQHVKDNAEPTFTYCASVPTRKLQLTHC